MIGLYYGSLDQGAGVGLTCGYSKSQIADDPDGNLLSMSGPLTEANTYRFSSKAYHPNSGLVYYLYRYYEPNLQR